MLEKYQDNLKIVFKHYPLSSHRYAANAALAAVAAQKQGKFWQYHDILFENYKTLNSEKFIDLAKQIGLDVELFKKTMSSQEARNQVISDHTNGREVGVEGTPAIYINGRKLRNRSLKGFQELIDIELKKQP